MTLDGYYLVPLHLTLDESGNPVVEYDPLGNGTQPQLKVDLEDNPENTYDQIQYRITLDPKANFKTVNWSFTLDEQGQDVANYVELCQIIDGERHWVDGVIIENQSFDATGLTEVVLNFGLASKSDKTKVLKLTDKFLSLTPVMEGTPGISNYKSGNNGYPPGGIIRN
ncbi:hypothetical protein [Ferrimonas balearica]|uniref:hypothetical protein n=1 Tax=Ferrimonas balearica TaxID=44012 RepID=UPI001C99104A|nr:hypothetical protein [Ferrimonas balearica]MBY5991531.1 hypothetical protein [Ferrimonas balearica]